MQERRYSSWKQLLMFALAGPPIGSLALYFGSGTGEQSLAQVPLGVLFWLQMTLPMTYFIGLLPALAAGVAAALARTGAPAVSPGAFLIRFITPLLVGSGASMAFPMLVLNTQADPSLAIVGGVAALVCTAWAEWRSSVRPNNSFKPKPLRGSA